MFNRRAVSFLVAVLMLQIAS
jgi:hypothetical protein